jgi:hypothetical protein
MNHTTTHSRFVDMQVAESAVKLALPTIEAALKSPGVSGLGVLHLVLLDPALRPGDCPFDSAVLYEYSVGERSSWDVDYAAFARSKAQLSWQHGMDSRQLQLMEPHRLRSVDALLWGGVWLDGIVVAASGAMPIWDEAFSLSVAGHLRALAWERAQLPPG